MKILSAILLAILLLPISPFLIIFFGGAELYRLYEDILRSVNDYLDRKDTK